jgi:uncharacterized membrane protein
MVIPLRPEESELWSLVERNEMPPPDSPRGPLSQAQKRIVREWIAAGCPEASVEASVSSPRADPEPTSSEMMELAPVEGFVRWLGKFHLLLLHFPIALVLAAGAGEFWAFWQRRPLPSEPVRFCLRLAAAAAIPTAALGWLLAGAGHGVSSPQLLMAHRWLGTTAAGWLAVTTVLVERDACRQVRSWPVRLLLLGAMFITALAAHFGGLLAHGEEFFRY